MAEFTIAFEMTDDLVSQAVREDSVAGLRELFKLRDLVAIAASTALFAWTIATGSHWIWWFAGLPAAVLVVVGAIWLGSHLLLPRLARKRLAHLPHRSVEVRLAETGITFQTATERLEVAWSELAKVRQRAGFWIVCLKPGTQIPVPTSALPTEAREMLLARVPAGKAGQG
jgi:hypothetical protein